MDTLVLHLLILCQKVSVFQIIPIYFILTNMKRTIKFINPKISYIYDKTLVLSIISDTCGSKNGKMFNKEESIEVLKILGLIKNMEEYQMNI